MRIVPPDGLLIACGDSDAIREIAAEAACQVVFYGLDERNNVSPGGEVELSASGTRLKVEDAEAGVVQIDLQLAGEHNASNVLAVWAAARADAIPAEAVVRALAEFNGVQRRMDEIGTERGITVVDDFAHHPTAVASTVAALRGRYPNRRLVLLFEPRSLTAGRSFLYDAYRRALAGVDVCFFAPIFHRDRLEPEDRLDLRRLTEDLGTRGVAAEAFDDVDRLFGATLDALHDGDVVVTMSSGAFDGMPHRILARLAGSEQRST